MAGMRDYSNAEIDLYARALAVGMRTAIAAISDGAANGAAVTRCCRSPVGRSTDSKVVDEISIDRKHMKGARRAKPAVTRFHCFPRHNPHILAWLQRMEGMLKVKASKDLDPSTRFPVSGAH